jgi:formamidopyrimidine-DNA glycosylase
MPELPEVETVVRILNSKDIKNSRINKIEIFSEKQIKELNPKEFSEKLLGKKIEKIGRKGK